MPPYQLQPDPKEVDFDAIRSIAYTLWNAKLSDSNCAGWDVANDRINGSGRLLFKALGLPLPEKWNP